MRKYEIARKLGQLEQENSVLIAASETKAKATKNVELLAEYYNPPTPSNTRPVTLTFTNADDEHEARVAILAVAFMLKNRADALDVNEGADVERVLAEYKRSSRYVELLGDVTEAERAAAVSLWDETAA